MPTSSRGASLLMWILALSAASPSPAQRPGVPTKDQVEQANPGNLRFLSDIISAKTPGHAVEVVADIKGAKMVTLVVSEGGDGYACDHFDWVDARFVGPAGEKRLTDLDYVSGTTGWGNINKNLSPAGSPMSVDGQPVANGIGCHSPSALVYKVPAGYDQQFAARASLDDSGVRQGGGSTVQAAVFVGLPTSEQMALFGMDPVAADLEAAEALKALTQGQATEASREFLDLCADLARRGFKQFNGGIADAATRAAQAANPEAVLKATDRDPVDVVLRRTRALWEDLKSQVDLTPAGVQLADLDAANARTAVKDLPARLALFEQATALRRRIAFSNPLLAGLDRILYCTRDALPPDEYNGGNHMCDQYFGFHATLHGKSRGTGLFVLEHPFSDHPTVTNLLADSVVQDGRYKGQKLDHGGFLSPELSFDGKTILFAWTEGQAKGREWRVWTPETCFHLFKCNADGSNLVQLTDGSVNDFQPCFLPNGRVCFISERRGGFGRCHGRAVPSFTLHSMFDDGSDIVCWSPHETNEWHPSVDNDGMVVYTRWDYVDRGFSQAHHAWITYPDGRDARTINGNTHVSERTAPHQEQDVKAVPGSPLYVAIAAGHHTEARGSVILIDPRIADDNAMSQVRRVTPDQLFPEAEFYHSRGSGAYASPWPLSEKYFLCTYDHAGNAQYGEINADARRYGITLLDVYGNKEILFRNPIISCASPIPLRPRTKPPVIPHETLVGRPADENGLRPAVLTAAQLPKTATVGCLNVYDSLRPMPAGVKIVALRIWQVMPKSTPFANVPRIGYGDQKPAKACLGTVPVEDDGSAYWEQPVGVPVLYHAIDEHGAAVQGMRSATYVHPGETLMCTGCHDNRVESPKRSAYPKALTRQPSVIAPEMDGTNPFNFTRLVQPVLDAKCVACHAAANNPRAIDLRAGDPAKNANTWSTSFTNLRPFVAFYDNATFTDAYTVPGRFGARASRLYAMLQKGHHEVALSDEEWRRLTIWMDSNGLFFGHERDLLAQAQGKVVWPLLQ
jgi:hypothetical protein